MGSGQRGASTKRTPARVQAITMMSSGDLFEVAAEWREIRDSARDRP